MFVDVGSGNGLPGLIFSILDEKLPVILLDVDKKKGEFLKTMVYRLGLKADVQVQSIEDFKVEKVPCGTIFIFRAFSPKQLALDFIKKNPSLKHVYFSSSQQAINLTIDLKPKKILNYSLSNGSHRKILLF